jgi:hypothetical protein
MQMFSPFTYGRPDAAASDPLAPVAAGPEPVSVTSEKASEVAIADLKRRMDEMSAQIEKLASGR